MGGRGHSYYYCRQLLEILYTNFYKKIKKLLQCKSKNTKLNSNVQDLNRQRKEKFEMKETVLKELHDAKLKLVDCINKNDEEMIKKYEEVVKDLERLVKTL